MIQCITKDDYINFCKVDKYHKGRWSYYKKVISLIGKYDFSSVLELGPYKHPIVKGCDVMDIKQLVPDTEYIHDASITPWPVSDKRYDLFIALQVWEHLGDQQKEVFKEVIRISRLAILSFPLNWTDCRKENCHYGITEEKIADWTNYIEPMHKIKVGKRIIYMFNFK